MNIVAQGINDGWLEIIKALYAHGGESSPRGYKIKEIKNLSIEIKNPKKRILSLPIRKMSLPFAFGELCWYLEARNDVAMMEYYSKRMRSFSDDGETLNSAYGYRIFGDHPMLPFDQWKFVVDKLREDPDSRQAIIHLHTPNNQPTKDEVCTLNLQFMIRDGKLDMFTTMRSNDIIWGFTYDVFSFTTFQELMANELGIEVGSYYHNAKSMHIYEKDFSYFGFMEIIEELLYMTRFDQEFDYEGLTIHDEEWRDLFSSESALRCLEDAKSSHLFIYKNKRLAEMQEIFFIYRQHKRYGKQTAKQFLRYDNVLHIMMRNYLSGKTLEDSRLVFFDGCDGAGKSTAIDLLFDNTVCDIVAFSKPDASFNPLVYFQTALLTGNIVLDRFYYSEKVYSLLFGRKPMINQEDIVVLESLLNFREAIYNFVNTPPELCFSRLGQEDAQIFSKQMIERICDSYELNFRTCNIIDKHRSYQDRGVK